MTDRERLIELITKEVPRPKADYLAIHLLANGVIVPPCKVGDYVLWNNGLKDSKNQLKEVKGFCYDSNDLGLRYILKDGQPIINHSGIVGVLTKEEAEQALKERDNNAR